MRPVIVIPAYNEAGSIGETVRGICGFCDVIVIDDCSKDATSELARAAGAQVFKNEVNSGYDKTIDNGFKKAFELNYTHVITFDADGQHPSSSIPLFIEHFKEGFQLILGVRQKNQRIGETIFSWFTQIFYGVKDPLSGLKGYDLKYYKELGHFDSYHSIGTELALYALKNKAKVIQIPYEMKDRMQGSPRFGSTLRANYKILRAMTLAFFI